MHSSLFIIAAFLCSYAVAFPAPQAVPSLVVPNEYIVVLKTTERVRSDEDHNTWVKGLMDGEFAADKTSVNTQYDFGAWKAYSITGPSALADTLAADGDVDWVQPVRIFKALGQNDNAPPGLRRTSSRNLSGSNAAYKFPDSAGKGVDAYIVDTGIRADHPEFEGRASIGQSFTGESTDNNGHGTHCAGTIGSKSFGMAPKVNLIGVQVLDGSGSGRSDAILSGLNFIRTSAKQRGNPSVVNMSLGGPADRALDRLVNTVISEGIVVVAAAGNDGADACGDSPGRAPNVITVGATEPRNDQLADFSNTGTCVDINAPGVDIQSTWIGNSQRDGDNGLTNTISGTSMACPHVVGAIALMLADQRNLSPAEVSSLLLQTATPDVLQVRRQTPNLLLFNGGVNGFSGGQTGELSEIDESTNTETEFPNAEEPVTEPLPELPNAEEPVTEPLPDLPNAEEPVAEPENDRANSFKDLLDLFFGAGNK